MVECVPLGPDCHSMQPPTFLREMFAPRSIALIGATDRAGSVGRALLENLSVFPCQLWPVNTHHAEIMGRACFSSLEAVPECIDLVVIATPAATIPDLIRQCVDKGVKAVVIISAGFKETGAAGMELESRILSAAKDNGLRIIGPNCLGIMVPHLGLNATFATAMAQPGRVAFLSQSGALCTAILDWSFRQNVSFSAFVSVGSMLDVGWGDLIEHFGEDEHTSSIVIYMESVGDAASFMKAARRVALKKPIVVIKVGRSSAAAKAAASHTGAMTGSDAVFDAACRSTGVLRVDTIEELFDMAEVLSKQPLPQGPNLAIVSNAGGPAALATDAFMHAGGTLATLSDETLKRLDAALPAHWSHANPVDVLGDADAARYAIAFRAVIEDPHVDGVLAVLTPQSMTQALATADALIEAAAHTTKPIFASWMGDAAVADANGRLNCAGLPTYPYPDSAARAFQHMWQRTHRLRLVEEARRSAATQRPSIPEVRRLIDEITQTGRVLLTEVESKQILAAAGIPVVETQHAATLDEAIAISNALGYPVVLKLSSYTITHKSDVGGVILNLKNSEAVSAAWHQIAAAVPVAAFQGVSVQRMIRHGGIEFIAGCSIDPQFGPVLLLGAGGTLAELLDDKALALPPLSPLLVMDWLAEIKMARALRGIRGQPAADLPALIDALVKLGDLILAEPRIVELDINPMIATDKGPIALDARVVIRAKE